MAGVFLCLVSSLSVAQCTYTMSSENRLTTQATTTKSFTWFATEKLDSGESKYDYVVVANKGGKIVCNTAEKAVSNCDIFVRGNNNRRYISHRAHFSAPHFSRGVCSLGAGTPTGSSRDSAFPAGEFSWSWSKPRLRGCTQRHLRHLCGAGHSEK